MDPVLVVVSDPDPVAARVAARWGTRPSTGEFVDGAAIRSLAPGVSVVRRPGPHVHDERLDLRLPRSGSGASPTVVFPSIHRSDQNVPCLTVHPLGNPGPTAEIGGRPRTLVPTDPRRMTAVLRTLAEAVAAEHLAATYEATHHGPELGVPAFFVEIGYGTAPEPSDAAVAAVADAIRGLTGPGEVDDRVALGVGGGHYAPHFTDLAVRRRWSFGHLLSRHALAELDRPTARAALAATPGADGIVYARASDADLPALRQLAPRLKDGQAPVRGPAARDPSATPGARSSAGT